MCCMTFAVNMSKQPDRLKGLEVMCGWSSEMFLYDQDHVHLKGATEIDYDANTNKVFPCDASGIPILEDPATKAAVYCQEKSDAPDNFLDGITSVSIAIIKSVQRHRGLFEPSLKWDTSAKALAYRVIALNVNKALNLSESNKLTGPTVKTKWENIRKGFSRALLSGKKYQYDKELQYVKKYLRSLNGENEEEQENYKRKASDSDSDAIYHSVNKKMKNSIDKPPETLQEKISSADSHTDKSSCKSLAAAANNGSELSFLHKTRQLQSIENQVTSATNATLKQASALLSEDSSESVKQENWCKFCLTIREALLTVPHDKLLTIVNGILKIMQRYIQKDG